MNWMFDRLHASKGTAVHYPALMHIDFDVWPKRRSGINHAFKGVISLQDQAGAFSAMVHSMTMRGAGLPTCPDDSANQT